MDIELEEGIELEEVSPDHWLNTGELRMVKKLMSSDHQGNVYRTWLEQQQMNHGTGDTRWVRVPWVEVPQDYIPCDVK